MPETTPAWLAERVKGEGEKVVSYFSSLSDEKWAAEVYTEGDIWTVHNILVHFVTAERGLLKLFINIREGGLGASDDFSIDRYNARQQEKAKHLSTEELLDQFVEVRGDLSRWVSNLSLEDLQKEGRHPFMGQVQLSEMIKMVYLHNTMHFRDFRKLVE